MHITYTMKRPKQEGRKVGEGGEERGAGAGKVMREDLFFKEMPPPTTEGDGTRPDSQGRDHEGFV